MKLLVIVLNKEEYLNDILEAFVEVGITGATIVDSVGMGHKLAYEIPIFAGLRKSIKTSDYNKTIFSVVQDDEILEEAIKLIDEIIDCNEQGSCLLFVVPLLMVKGLKDNELTW
ncbi:MAG: P-II family nitrogen regulator [bacterium]